MTAVLGVAQAVDGLLVAGQGFDQRAVQRVVDKDPVAGSGH